MNKFFKPALATLVAAIAISMPITQAQTVSNTFNVSVELTSVCRSTSAANQALAFGTYTAFQESALANTTGIAIAFACTRGLAPSVAFDGGLATGSVGGLNYTLTVGAATTGTGTGNSETYSYTITGSIAAAQAGDALASVTDDRTLILTY